LVDATCPLGTAPRFPASQLQEALSRVPDGAWGQVSTLEQSGTHDGYRILSLVQPGRLQPHASLFAFVLREFAPVFQAWVSWLAPGGYILPHVDAGPYRERWQVPLRPAGEMDGVEATAGEAFRVRHWEPHSVTNQTDRARVHIVIDRDVVVDAACVPFQRVEVSS
jgi:hypothetical protein